MSRDCADAQNTTSDVGLCCGMSCNVDVHWRSARRCAVPDLGCVPRAQTAQPRHLQPFVAKHFAVMVLTERFAILQGDEGDGSCSSYALGRVCDSAAVDHEPFTDDTTVLSKTMDYKKGHDAGFAAVCAPSSPFLPAPVIPILANVTDRLHCLAACSSNDTCPPPLYAFQASVCAVGCCCSCRQDAMHRRDSVHDQYI